MKIESPVIQTGWYLMPDVRPDMLISILTPAGAATFPPGFGGPVALPDAVRIAIANMLPQDRLHIRLVTRYPFSEVLWGAKSLFADPLMSHLGGRILVVQDRTTSQVMLDRLLGLGECPTTPAPHP